MSKGKENVQTDARKLSDLRGIGPAMLKDFEMLGVKSVSDLAREEGDSLYDRLNALTRTRQDPCVLDTFRCAVAQARDRELPSEMTNWWYWSRKRKSQVAKF